MHLIDWTQGGTGLHYQRCAQCAHVWYFQREFCPQCGHAPPERHSAAGRGVVHASTLVHRAPSDEFRAIAPYRIVLVDMDEGFRMMGHGAAELSLSDAVRCEIRPIAGRLLPFFLKDHDAA